MSRVDALYMRSPVWLQRAAVAGWGWWWYKRRFGDDFTRLVDELRAHERWTAEQFNEYQTAALDRILRAAANSPHYRAVFGQTAITAHTPPREALQRLPILSKEQLRRSARQLLTGPLPKDVMVFRSSGTTGTPTEIFYTRGFHAVEVATIEARNLNWGGATYRDRRVMFGARKICRFDQTRPPFWRHSPAENLAYASVYHLSPEYLPAYMRFLQEFRPVVVMGYPSALYAVATFALEQRVALPAARAVFTSAERLTDEMREAIERAWNTRVFDRYGAVEGCVAATQCEHGAYHVNSDIGIFEILDRDGRPAPPGVEGEVVCTGLHNTLQPLIRYRIGDYARWSVNQACRCGRQLPIIEGIDGRLEDTCFTVDGRPVVRFDTVFKGVANIRQAQVIQDRLDAFTIVIDAADGFAARDVEQLEHNLRQHVGNVVLTVKHVENIPRTAAGKFRAVVCRLSPEERERIRRPLPAGAAGAR